MIFIPEIELPSITKSEEVPSILMNEVCVKMLLRITSTNYQVFKI